jgi:hypothetical protein
LGAPPRQRCRLELAVDALWCVSAQLKAFAIDLHQPHLLLSEPKKLTAISWNKMFSSSSTKKRPE